MELCSFRVSHIRHAGRNTNKDKMKLLTVLISASILFHSCERNKDKYFWADSNGNQIPIKSISYEIRDSILKQEFIYESTFEYFEINFNSMVGKHLPKRLSSDDSILSVKRIYCEFPQKDLEVYKLSFGYNDLTFDNEVDFYLEKKRGVFMISSPNSSKSYRLLVR